MCVIPVVTSIKEEEKLIQSSTKVHAEHHCCVFIYLFFIVLLQYLKCLLQY